MSQDTLSPLKRRQFIASSAVGVTIGVAGCSGGNGNGNESNNNQASGGQVPTIVLNTRSSEAQPVNNEQAQMIQNVWMQLGLNVEFNSMAHQAFIDRVYNQHDYEAAVGGWGGAVERLDPFHHLYDTHFSENTDSGERNLTHYNNPEYDEMAEEMNTELDQKRRQELAMELQAMLAEDQPSIPLHSRPLLDVVNDNTVKSIVSNIGSGVTGYFNFVRCETSHGEFRWGGRGTVNTLNVLDVPSFTDQQMNNLIHDRPFQFGPEGDLQPSLCDSSEIVNDTTIQLTLRDGPLYFHDGEEITPEDLVYSYELQAEVAIPTGNFLEPLESAEVIDDRTVQLNLSEPNAPFMTLGLAFPYVLAEHWWGNEVNDPKEEANIENPVGSGPFEFEAWRPEEEASVTKFSDHHSPPNVDRVIKVMGPLESLLRSLEQGNIDAVWGSGMSVGAIQNAAEADHLSIKDAPNHGVDVVFLQNTVTPFSDKAFRRALANAVPKQEIHDAILQGFGDIINTPVAPANSAWHNPDVEAFGDDIEAARAELEEAGYSWNNDGMLMFPE